MSARGGPRVVAAFAVVYLVWGSTYLAIRYAVETLPPFLMAGSRFVLAGSLLYGWALWRGASTPPAVAWRWALLVGALFVPLGNGLVVWAEQRVPSALAALVAAGIPLWVALFERLAPNGARLTRARLVGLLVGFAGVVVLVGGDGLTLTAGPRVGAVAVASIASALGMVVLRRAPLPADSALSSSMTMLTGGGFALLVGWAAGEASGFTAGAVSTLSLAAYTYLVLFGSVLAFTCFTFLARTVSPSRASTHAYVNPLVALALGAGLGGERLGIRALAATPLILGGLALVLGGGACVPSALRRSLRLREPASGSGDHRAALPLARCDRAGAG